jgi:DNA-binding response OmpR family regulator
MRDPALGLPGAAVTGKATDSIKNRPHFPPPPDVSPAAMNILLINASSAHCDMGLLACSLSLEHEFRLCDLRELEAVLAEKAADLIVLAMDEPWEKSAELLSHLRRDHPRMGLIALAANVPPSSRLKAYLCGADIYLQGPVDGSELRAAVDSLARRLARQETGSARPEAQALGV